MRFVDDPTLPSRRLTDGKSVGVLEGMGDAFGNGSLSPAARLFGSDYLESGAAGEGLGALGSAAPTKATHRLVVRFHGDGSKLEPLTRAEVLDAASEVEAESGGKIRIVYSAGSPSLTAVVPKGQWRPGTALQFRFEADVVLSGVSATEASAIVSRVIDRDAKWYSAGLKLIDAILSVGGGIVGGGAMTLLKKLWKPALIVGGLYLAWTIGLPMLKKKSVGRARRRRR